MLRVFPPAETLAKATFVDILGGNSPEDECAVDAIRRRRASEAGASPRVLAARTNAWLTEVGAWIFGGLLALNLVLIASLLDVGPVDTAILISICALGCALSVNVVGIVLNRLVKDIKYVELAERLPILQEIGDAESSEIEALYPSPEERVPVQQRRSTMALWSSLGLAALSGVLTTIGLVAALWHMAWWVGVAGLVTAALSATLIGVVFVSTKPPVSEADKVLIQRYVDRRTREAQRRREQHKGRRAARDAGRGRRVRADRRPLLRRQRVDEA